MFQTEEITITDAIGSTSNGPETYGIAASRTVENKPFANLMSFRIHARDLRLKFRTKFLG